MTRATHSQTEPMLRDRFSIPLARDVGGTAEEASVYLVGNSLGCMPHAAREAVLRELDDWARLGVEGHFHARWPWYSAHEPMMAPGARLVGAKVGEVTFMNGLTTNLHLMMASFYRPAGSRTKILIEDDAFGSDSYAVRSQAAWHGLDPDAAIVRLKPRAGERTLRDDDIVETIHRLGDELALVMLGGVNYLTGQWFDMPKITAAGHEVGARVGWDLAHAAGNVPMRLHEWGVDFACWCSYKYLNAGPGAVSGVFVHEKHGEDDQIPKLAGWWGTDPAVRFKMEPVFRPKAGVEGWQHSNPPILSLTPVRVSLELFDEVGMDRLRERSLGLTGLMEALIRERLHGRARIVTPEDPARRGCQLSIEVARARGVQQELLKHGVVADFREPDIVRVAPVPMYNTTEDVERFVRVMEAIL